MRRIAFLVTFCGVLAAHSQDSLEVQEVLTIQDYINIVLANHPIIRQAELFNESADANLRLSRGQFDPKIESSYSLKEFKDTRYYDIFNATLKIPTWFPVDPKISVDQTGGTYLNPERTIPASNDFRQISAGISIPIGQGLFMDERRSTVRQARIYQNIAEAERVKLSNKILLTSIKDYWNWYMTFLELRLLENSIYIADELFDRVKLDYEFGEAAVVDTIQAKITYQTRLAEYEKIKFEYQKSRLKLATHLWSPEEFPLELQENTIPDTTATFGNIPSDEELGQLIQWARTNHPEIQKLNGKIQQLEIELKWSRELLKPKLDFSYYFVNTPLAPEGDFVAPNFDDYKLGLDFSFPIFLRKARGKLQSTKLKIESQQYERIQTEQVIQNNILAKFAEIQMAGNLADQYRSMAQNYDRLVRAEILNLETGESDLFKLNIQQDKYISSQIKYYENLVKFQKTKIELMYESGMPLLNLSELLQD